MDIYLFADCDDGNLALLLELHLYGLGRARLFPLFIGDGADFHALSGLSLRADGPGHVVAVLALINGLGRKVIRPALRLEVGHADLGPEKRMMSASKLSHKVWDFKRISKSMSTSKSRR